MGVLKVKVDGEWVAVPGSNAASEEVAVGPNDPGPTYDLWYDTDESASSSSSYTAKWSPATPIERPAENIPINAAWGQYVHDRQVDTSLQFYGALEGAAMTPGDAVNVTVTLTPRLDVGSCWQAASSAWRAPKAGWIEVTVGLLYNLGPPGPTSYTLAIYKNALQFRCAQTMDNAIVTWEQFNATRLIQVVAGDLITLQFNCNAPGCTKYIYATGDYTFMGIRYLQTT